MPKLYKYVGVDFESNFFSPHNVSNEMEMPTYLFSIF